MAPFLTPPYWWFGLTQRQEAQLGWDAAETVGGVWTLFQIKASSRVLANGRRRFNAQHHQLTALMNEAGHPFRVFYVLPMLGTTNELVAANFELLPRLRLLDAHQVPPGIGPPTTAAGAARKSGIHYMDLHANGAFVTIHSDPIELPTQSIGELAERLPSADERVTPTDPASRRREADAARRFLLEGRNRMALLLAPQQ